jgi:tRNA (guanine37-N1)-methyltransferase
MLLRVDVMDAALTAVAHELADIPQSKRRSLLLCPQGQRFCQPHAEQLATSYEQITLVCGHYEGFDERIRGLVDEQVSLGDFVMTGGEIAAMAIIDATIRLAPGVITEGSPEEESFSIKDETGKPLLEYPHYTRPVEYKGQRVPDVLLSGHHAEIAKWRLEQAKIRTGKD